MLLSNGNANNTNASTMTGSVREGRPALLISTRELVCGEPPKTARVLKILRRRRRGNKKRPKNNKENVALQTTNTVSVECDTRGTQVSKQDLINHKEGKDHQDVPDHVQVEDNGVKISSEVQVEITTPTSDSEGTIEKE